MTNKELLTVYKGRDITEMSRIELAAALALTIKELHRARREHLDFVKRIASYVDTSDFVHKLDKTPTEKK